MTRTQFFLVCCAVGLFLNRQPTAPRPLPPEPEPLGGLGAISVDVPDDVLAHLGSLMSSRTIKSNGWDITLADGCVMRFVGNKIIIDGGIRVNGKVWRVPVGTSVYSLEWAKNRVIIDLNGLPLDVVLQ